MILIADSGSTITNWVVLNKNKTISSFNTIGLNPYFTKSEEVFYELEKKFPKNINSKSINKVFFYGSGCSAIEMKKIICQGLNRFFLDAEIEINNDLLAAARSLFKIDSGIVLILGTGASSCFYNGSEITKRVPSLGYILGDEGGGTYLGKLFITEYLYGNLSDEICMSFENYFKLSPAQILNNIYKDPHPNSFIASFSKFVFNHSKDIVLNDLVLKSFHDLFEKNVTKYQNYKNSKIGVIGSVGFYFAKQLKEVASSFNASIDLIQQSPMDGLIQYHSISN